jgi:hypothetical protein
MRVTLDALDAELRAARRGREGIDLRAMVVDLLEGEVAAPTADVADLVRRGVDPAGFYEREVAPSWEGLDEGERETRLGGFIEMCSLMAADSEDGLPGETAAVVRTKTLILAWAFDRTYGYLSRLEQPDATREPPRPRASTRAAPPARPRAG